MKKTMLSAALLATLTLSTAKVLADSPYIVVWESDIGSEADTADFIVYNMLDQDITLENDSGWLHSDILGKIPAYSSKVDGSIGVKNDTSGSMKVSGKDGFWFDIKASKSGATNIWTFDGWTADISGGSYSSIAQINTGWIMASLFACPHIDSGDGITGVGGPTQIVLLLSLVQNSDFTQSTVKGKFCANSKSADKKNEFSYNKQ
ncbi:MAG: hypothetical protein QG599_1579 [Pseudomonadota bacterium]|nr:hypothetical protein [Pseudomonadota bacterium]